MKTLPCLFVFAAGLLLGACNSDDDTPAVPDNNTPEDVILNSPANDTDEIDPDSVALTWKQALDPDGDMVSYNVFLDKNNPPATLVVSGTTAGVYTVENPLDFDTSYYWKVIAADNKGGESESDIAMFTTRKATTADFITGRWYLESIVDNDGVGEDLDDCKKNSYMQFTAEGAGAVATYSDSASGCYGSIRSLEYELVSDTEIKIIYTDIIEEKTKRSEREELLIVASITETRIECQYASDDKTYIFSKELLHPSLN